MIPARLPEGPPEVAASPNTPVVVEFGSTFDHNVHNREWGQVKRRVWTLRTRPMAANIVRVLDPP